MVREEKKYENATAVEQQAVVSKGVIEMINEYQETLTRQELKELHGPNGGYVLHDHEFNRFKGWLTTLAAAAEFEAAFPELVQTSRYTTADFAKLYAERE